MCKAPLARLEKFERYTNKQGGTSYQCDFVSWPDVERNPRYYKNKYRRVDMIPCGQCLECRLNKARDKANQMMLERTQWPEERCWFLTLTYNDEHLRTHVTVNEETGERVEGISLCKKDTQDFVKRLRMHYERKYNNKGIRYVIVGEYGSKTNRPHAHMIVYNLDLDQTKLKFYKHNEEGQTIWTHEELEKIWGLGFVTVGRVTWESCCYVARYMMKKQYGKNSWIYGAQGKIPEYVNQSLKPAIGRGYLLEHKEDLYITQTIPICNKKTSELMPLPKSFMRWVEKNEPEEYKELRLKRKLNAESTARIQNTLTDLQPWEYRLRKDEMLNKKMVDMRKEL